jgi:uncharacterized protein (DUF427 family)
MWTYQGNKRPPFALTPASDQESVWDYPRPPVIVADARRVVVRAGSVLLADTRRAVRVLETASPPTFYLPPDDAQIERLRRASGSSRCEWKGLASYWSVVLGDGTGLEQVCWSYDEPEPAFACIAGWLSFYPGRVACEVDQQRVRPQPGGFYGGWLTDEIVGPVKGDPGTGGW